MQSNYGVLVASLLLVIGGTFALLFLGNQDGERNRSALLKALPNAKLSLADGIRQAAKPPEGAISAKFELDEKGNLSISVYTVEKGVTVDAYDNVFKEVSGNAMNEAWTPAAEVIKDSSDLTEAKTQLAIMSRAKVTLLDVVEKARGQGTVVSAIPESRRGTPFFDVEVLSRGRIKDLAYDTAGNPISSKEEDEKDDDDD